jgi:nicotinic acid mononucleotide adenylyltransferase
MFSYFRNVSTQKGLKKLNIKKIILIILCLYGFSAKALVLEQLAQDKELEITLKNQKICFYAGSFDPLHKGHEEVAMSLLKEALCDFVLIYPSWGGDSYKNRTDLKFRLNMLFSVFKYHPHVIVTSLPPKELQAILTIPDPAKRLRVKPAFEGMHFVGIVGSDNALKTWPGDDESFGFMAGVEIPEKYSSHTMGGLMALPVDSFIIAMRYGDDISPLKGQIGYRRVIAVIESDQTNKISSTSIRNLLKSKKSIDGIVSKPVARIIEKYELYK